MTRTVGSEEASIAMTDAPAQDGTAFGEWVGPHLAMLRALAAAEVGPADADDVVQEALLRAWRRRSTFDSRRGSPRAWLAAIVLDRARRHRVRRRPEPVFAPGTSPVSGEHEHLDLAVARLPRRQREVVTLHYLVDLSVRDVAAALGITEGAVKAQLHDARANLRTALEQP